jgi:hypothetical protein
VLNDALVEVDETVIVTLTSIASGDPQISIGAPDTATVTIVDDMDFSFVSIAATDDAAEPADPGQFTVSLTAQSSTPTEVSYTIAGTASAGADYTALSGTVIIPAFALSATIPVSVIDDDHVEGDETVAVTLVSTSGNPRVNVGAPSSASVVIHDNDTTTVSIAATDAAAGETPTNPGQFTVTLANGKTAPAGGVLISYSVGGTATPTGDYAALSGSVLIPAGSGSATIDVAGIVDDNIVEAAETVVVMLTGANHPGVSVGAPSSANVTIADNDATAFTIGDASTVEGGTITFTVSLSNPIDIPVAVNVSYSDTTTSSGDFDHAVDALTFPALSTSSQSVTVATTNDNVAEATETFLASLSSSAALGGRSVSLSDTAVGTITDNDAAAFTINDVSASEAAGTMTFTVSLSSPIDIPVVVNVAYSDTTTSASDFDHATDSVTFPAGSTTSQSVTVAITNDNVVEATETFLASLSTSTALGGRNVSLSDTGVGTITDNDSAAFTINDVSANEGAGTMSFTVSLSNPIDIPVAVNVSYADTTTTAGDFDHTTDSVTFPASSTASQMVTVSITNDNIVEAAETFLASLGTSTALGGRNVSLSDTGVGTITDNDSAAFTINDASAGEGGTVTFTVSLSNPIDIPVAVNVGYADLTTSGSDFDHTTDSVTFPALSTAPQTVTVAVANDNVVEATETFRAALGTSTVLGSRSVSLSDTGIGTITDDDTATFSINDVSANESAGTITFTVSLSNPVDTQVSVVATTANNTATTADNDYAAKSATVTFSAGQISQPFTVTINNDTKVEPNETFFVNLSSPSVGGRPVTIGDGQGVGQINNDDNAVVSIVASDPEATEPLPVDNGQFLVTMSSPSQVTTVISFVVSGTATNGSDYVSLAPLEVTFAPGETSAVIDVVPLSDGTAETDETVIVTLSAVTAGVAGAVSIAPPPNNSATVVIHDPTVTIADNHDPGWETFGFIRNTAAGYLQDYAYGGNNVAAEFGRWTINVLPGQYRVSVTWPNIVLSPRATNAPFSVYDGTIAGTLLGTALINQTGAPLPHVVDGGFAFQDLIVGGNGGIYTINSGVITVQLTDQGINGLVIADAVRVERLMPQEADFSGASHDAGGTMITAESVAPLVQTGIAHWGAADPSAAAQLSDVQVVVADLPQRVLSLASPATNTIWLDVNGAGAGWAAQAPATSRFDLATVVAHELGHLLGFGDLDAAAKSDNLMAGQLSPGISRLPGTSVEPVTAVSHAARDSLFAAFAPASGVWSQNSSPSNARDLAGFLDEEAFQQPDSAEYGLASLNSGAGLKRGVLRPGDEAGPRTFDGASTSRSMRRSLHGKFNERDLDAIADEILAHADEPQDAESAP